MRVIRYLFLLMVLGFAACDNGGTSTTENQRTGMRLDTAEFNTLYEQYEEKSLFNRRFKHRDIDSLVRIRQQNDVLDVETIVHSVQGRSIYELTYGSGDKKVMLWSQMHRSEEHTSELQSRENLVCRLLLEK